MQKALIFNPMRLSVVIPVYQSSNYLERCVKSVLSQSFHNFELILIDDGSTDGCYEICNSLAAKDSRIVVEHTPNRGLGAARNRGIELAKGKYITFIDSDDEIVPDTFAPNMEILENEYMVDMLEYPISVHHNSKREKKINFKPLIVSRREVFRHWLKSEGFKRCYACNKIFSRSLFDDLRFPEGESFEDAAICPKIVKLCNAICYSNKGLYLYHANKGGITHNYSFTVQEPLLRHNITLLSSISHLPGLKRESVKIWHECLNILIVLYRCPDPDIKYIEAATEALNIMKPNFFRLILSWIGIKNTLKDSVAIFFGVKAHCRLFK